MRNVVNVMRVVLEVAAKGLVRWFVSLSVFLIPVVV